MLPTIYIETERLILRSWIETDVDPYIRMNLDPAVRRYFPGLQERGATLTSITRIQAEIDTRGYGLFAVVLQSTGAFIGFIGLTHTGFEAPFTPCVEIGWRLDPVAWGQGYATEGARACLEAAFNRWDLPEVYSFTSIHNIPSEKVMQRIGMQRLGTFQHPLLEEGHWLREHVLYRAVHSSF